MSDYNKPAGRWSGNGCSPTDNTGGHAPECDEWRQRDLVMMVALISRIQEIQRWPSTFRNPGRRRAMSQVLRNTQSAMMGVQSGGRLSETARGVVERYLLRFKLPMPVRPTSDPRVGAVDFEVFDGMAKPLKPPVRIRLEGDD